MKTVSTFAADYLIVDDEPDLCWAMEHMLKMSGLSAATARRGAEALTLLKQHQYRLVFMDAKLPDMDGLALARQARAIDPAVRILLVSGYFYRDDHIIQQALEEGVISGFVAKPFIHSDILAAINREQLAMHHK